MKILAIDSSYDKITQASYVYRNRHVYPYLESKGFEVVRCQGRFARRVYVQNGCLAYFGYNEDFIVLMHVSDAFFDCDSEIDRAFADGFTVEEVYDRVIAYYNQKILELKEGKHYDAVVALEYNRDHLCAPSVNAKWGDRKARIV